MKIETAPIVIIDDWRPDVGIPIEAPRVVIDFDEDQPRHPAGSGDEGGQWSGGGGSGGGEGLPEAARVRFEGMSAVEREHLIEHKTDEWGKGNAHKMARDSAKGEVAVQSLFDKALGKLPKNTGWGSAWDKLTDEEKLSWAEKANAAKFGVPGGEGQATWADLDEEYQQKPGMDLFAESYGADKEPSPSSVNVNSEATVWEDLSDEEQAALESAFEESKSITQFNQLTDDQKWSIATSGNLLHEIGAAPLWSEMDAAHQEAVTARWALDMMSQQEGKSDAEQRTSQQWRDLWLARDETSKNAIIDQTTKYQRLAGWKLDWEDLTPDQQGRLEESWKAKGESIFSSLGNDDKWALTEHLMTKVEQGAPTPESWDEMSGDKQEQYKEKWFEASFNDYMELEVQNWNDSQAGEDAQSAIANDDDAPGKVAEIAIERLYEDKWEGDAKPPLLTAVAEDFKDAIEVRKGKYEQGIELYNVDASKLPWDESDPRVAAIFAVTDPAQGTMTFPSGQEKFAEMSDDDKLAWARATTEKLGGYEPGTLGEGKVGGQLDKVQSWADLDEHVRGTFESRFAQEHGVTELDRGEMLQKLWDDNYAADFSSAFESGIEKWKDDWISDADPKDWLKDSVEDYQAQSWEEKDDNDKWEAVKSFVEDDDDFKTADGEPIVAGAVTEPSSWQLFNSATDARGYKETQATVRRLTHDRTKELFKERDVSLKGGDESAARQIGQKIWSEWKSNSNTSGGLALQLAVENEFGTRQRMTGEQRARAERWAEDRVPGGMAALQAYSRAQWEVTQFALAKANVHHVPIYRAIIMDNKELVGDRRETVGIKEGGSMVDTKNLTALPDKELKRNSAASFTMDLDVANRWNGAGGRTLRPGLDTRLVIRADLPRTALLSVPAFGQNVYGEQEGVGMGSAWKSWDVWANKAPSFDQLPIRAMGAKSEKAAPETVDRIAEAMQAEGYSAPDATSISLLVDEGKSLEVAKAELGAAKGSAKAVDEYLNPPLAKDTAAAKAPAVDEEGWSEPTVTSDPTPYSDWLNNPTTLSYEAWIKAGKPEKPKTKASGA